MTTTPFAQCPVCGNRADGQITIPTKGCATVFNNHIQYTDCNIDQVAYTECNACDYRAPFHKFVSGVKSLSSTELEELITFLGEVAKFYKHASGENMAYRCIGQLRYLDYFRQPQDEEDIMTFVDHLLHEHPQVQDYEYDYVPPATAGDQ